MAIKINQDREVLTSHLPFKLSPDVNDGISEAALYDVKVIESEPSLQKRNGEPSLSIYAGAMRPYLAFYFKQLGQVDETRSRVQVVRFFPGEYFKTDGTPIDTEVQEREVSNIIDKIIHIYNEITNSKFCTNTRPLKTFTVDDKKLLSDDVKERIAEYNKLFNAFEKAFKGTDEKTTAIYVSDTNPEGIPIWLKVIANWNNTQYDIPKYVGKGFCETVRMNGKNKIKPQIYIDHLNESILLVEPDKEEAKEEPIATSATNKIKAGLNLG